MICHLLELVVISSIRYQGQKDKIKLFNSIYHSSFSNCGVLNGYPTKSIFFEQKEDKGDSDEPEDGPIERYQKDDEIMHNAQKEADSNCDEREADPVQPYHKDDEIQCDEPEADSTLLESYIEWAKKTNEEIKKTDDKLAERIALNENPELIETFHHHPEVRKERVDDLFGFLLLFLLFIMLLYWVHFSLWLIYIRITGLEPSLTNSYLGLEVKDFSG